MKASYPVAGLVQRILGERGRWWLASLLDRSRSFCWADLVAWALAWDKGEDTIRGAFGLDRCRDSARREHGCYCGKVRPDGYVLKAGETVEDHPGEIENCPCGPCRVGGDGS